MSLRDTIQTNAAAPKSATGGDGRSATQHDLSQQIAADKHLAAASAMNQPAGGKRLGLRMVKLRPPGPGGSV